MSLGRHCVSSAGLAYRLTIVIIVHLQILFACVSQSTADASSRIDSFYIFHRAAKSLPLRLNQIAVTLNQKKSTDDQNRALDAAGIRLSGHHPIWMKHWHILYLEASLATAEELYTKLEFLTRSDAFDFVSPVFDGEHGTFVAITQYILIQFNEETVPSAEAILLELAPELEITQENFGNMNGAFRLRSNSKNGFDVLALANDLANDPRVKWAEPDMRFSGGAGFTPNDPGFADLWGIRNTGQFGGMTDIDMDADEAWDITTGDPSIKVLIIDTGVEQDHPDINQLPGGDFTWEGGDGGPNNVCDNHGTAVAGCVSAIVNNSLGTIGVAPGCKVISARAFVSNLSCDGSWAGDASGTVNALAWGQSIGVRVTNNSNYYGFSSSAIEATYDQMHAAGVVHFASAGNFSSPSSTYPASLPSVNSISAMEPSGDLASFSNFGSDISLAAPGSIVYSTDRTGPDGYSSDDYAFVYGTSFASPYSAGVAALILSLEPSLIASQVEAKLYCTARDLGVPGRDDLYGHGMVNALDAVAVPWASADSDGDMIPDFCDNCSEVANPSQSDSDFDGAGDVCDDDDDNDGILDAVDNCHYAANNSQTNSDSDSLGDACDNCDFVGNDSQFDENDDGVGDACDGNLHIQNYTMPDGYLTLPYSASLIAVGGTPPYSWTFLGGDLPFGLTFNGGTVGTITGTPSFMTTFYFTFKVDDSGVPTKSDTVSTAIEILAPAFICGDADGNLSVTVSDVVYLINYVFAGGPAPDPLISADADCTGIVTVSDAVYLINFIFGGGPVPCASCP